MRKILIADDNAISRELVLEALGDDGYQLLEADDGREALATARQTRPDLVLLDIQMPQMDGYAVLKSIREDPDLAGLRVVALTAFAMEGDREKALQAGFDDYVTKPIQIVGLRSLVRSLLS